MPTTSGSRPGFLRGKKALVVEDEFLIGLDIQQVLESEGCQSQNVARNRAALALLTNERFDIAILDYKLNGDNSLPVAEQLLTLGIPFVFLTGASTLQMPAKYRDIPVVTKPFDTVTLLDALREAIKRG